MRNHLLQHFSLHICALSRFKTVRVSLSSLHAFRFWISPLPLTFQIPKLKHNIPLFYNICTVLPTPRFSLYPNLLPKTYFYHFKYTWLFSLLHRAYCRVTQLLHQPMHYIKFIKFYTLKTLRHVSVLRSSSGSYNFLAKVTLEIVTY